MSNKQIWIWLFVSGMLLGAVIAWATLFLSDYFNRPQPTIEEAWEYLLYQEVAREAETQVTINELLAGQEDPFLNIVNKERKLCSVLTISEINRLIPGIAIVSSEDGKVPPFSDCDYLRAGSNVPIVSFKYSFANLQIIKDLQKAQGLDAKTRDLVGIGDEAFLSEIIAIPGADQSFRAIFFRVGGNGYSVGSFELTESQLRVVAGFASEKLVQ